MLPAMKTSPIIEAITARATLALKGRRGSSLGYDMLYDVVEGEADV
jgi:hypothetical protein